ncbi:hypothetical protein F4859DRAFT_510805 [Xylaria cf. heliscus]|nr:hypothetical protein F4859DRAFT_510805 [Xylaria cf. heliscus]
MALTNPRFLHEQADLEVVPPETGLHPLPVPTPLYPAPHDEPTHSEPTTTTLNEPLPKEQIVDLESGARQQTPSHAPDQPVKNTKPTVLGLAVPVFWALIITLFIVLAAGIGGGVGGGLSAQRKSVSGSNTSSDGNVSGTSGGGSSTSSPAPSPTSSSTSDPLVPTDGGCPNIDGLKYMPYSADGKPIPVQTNQDPQEFREQCWTNWVNTASTHDILRTYTPTLENCITVCAEYNKAYATNLQNNVGAGGGPCVAVTIVKDHAGFCYLKNGTGTNDTMGSPNVYSSAVLITD